MLTLLLIDDEPSVRNIMQTVLVRAGYEVLTAASGPAALQLNQSHAGDIALVISDLQMPNMSGQETVRQLLRKRPGLKVIYVSGYSDEPLPSDDLAHQCSRYLAKPFPMAELVQTVQALLASPTP